MNILFLRGFNNYFNRIIKKYSTLADYRTNSQSYVEFSNINFDMNDGISTILIVGSHTQLENNAPLNWDNNGTPDYLVCYETANNVNTIKSRWYILESEKTRDGQYRLALKRDIIADHYSEVMSAPCFVEKGIINDVNNPLLVNSEGSELNQIKKEEIPIKDESNCAWIVTYLKKNAVLPSGKNPITAYIGMESSGIIDASTLPFKDCISYPGETATKHFIRKDPINIQFSTNMTAYTNGHNHFDFKIRTNGNTDGTYVNFSGNAGGTPAWDSNGLTGDAFSDSDAWGPVEDDGAANAAAFNNSASSSGTAMFNEYYPRIISGGNFYDVTSSTDVANVYNQYNGTYVLHNNKVYQLNISYMSTAEKSALKYRIPLSFGNDAKWITYANWIVTTVNDGWSRRTDTSATTASIYFLPQQGLIINAVLVGSTGVVSYTVPGAGAGGRNALLDELYDIIAFPYNPKENIQFYNANGNLVTLSNDASTAIANNLITAFGTGDAGYSVDIQLLPYCPVDLSGALTNGKIDLRKLTATTDYTEIKTEVSPVTKTFALYPKYANFTKFVNITRNLNNYSTNSALNKKLNNECCFTRLTSPNFNGSFEFKKSKLENGIIYINIDCTYKPFSPYIKVNPNFDGLYGIDWNDSTGLILGGEFSLPIITDYWTQYQLSNKNYQQIFDRQIQNMDVNKQIANEQRAFNAVAQGITGTIGAGVGGALVGAKAGPYGALAGAATGLIGGAIMNAVGAEKDREWMQRQQAEAKDYAIDMYNYQLGNIKALPQSLSKSSPLTFNNKIWPIIEEFSCTDTEIELLKSKIEYNSMTIMAIGTLNTYATSPIYSKVYVKGQLIRCETIADDFHIIDAIYQEVNKGFFIPQGA